MSTDPDPQAAHRRTWNDIPWVVAGTAPPDQRRAVHAHIAGCADCRSEFAFQQQVRDALHSAATPVHGAEPAWERMQARLSMEIGGSAAGGVSGSALAGRSLHGTPGRGTSGWTRLWAGVAVLQTVCLVLLGVGLTLRGGNLPGDVGARVGPGAGVGLGVGIGDVGGDYRTYSSADASPGKDVATIRLVPQPDLSALELRLLLARHGLRAIDISGDALSLGVAPVAAGGAGYGGSAGSAGSAGKAGSVTGGGGARAADHVAGGGDPSPAIHSGNAAAGEPQSRLHRLRADPGVLLAEPIDPAR